jgi:hypothetical protein
LDVLAGEGPTDDLGLPLSRFRQRGIDPLGLGRVRAVRPLLLAVADQDESADTGHVGQKGPVER